MNDDQHDPFGPASLIEWAVSAGLAIIVFAWLARFGFQILEG